MSNTQVCAKKCKRKRKGREDTCYLHASVATVLLPGFTVGTLIGWEHVHGLNNDSNVVSVPFLYISGILGALITAHCMDRYGRHCCIVTCFWLIYVPIILYLIIGNMVIETCIVRAIAGLSVGAYLQVVPIYIAELCYRRHRGILIGALGCTIAIGIIASSNSFASSTLLVVDLFLAVAFILLLIRFVPETPYYDIDQNYYILAKQTLQRCRTGDQWTGEIREISLDVAAYPRDASNCFSFTLSFFDMDADFLHRSFTVVGLLMFSQCVHVSANLGFQRYYFQTEDRIQTFFIQIMLVILAYIVNIFVIDVMGRKVLLFTSAIGVTLFYFILFIMLCDGYDVDSLGVTVVWKLIVFYYYLGLDFIPILYMCEIMPYTVRASAVAFFLCLFFIARSILPVINFYTQIYVSVVILPLLYFFVALASIFFIWFVPPETKQMSLCAIQIKMDSDVDVLEDSLEVE